jgi:glycosyltransferase involved in cell wall biosynthesis
LGGGLAVVKVHVFIPDLTPGGAERVFSTLLRLWDRQTDEVTLVVLRRVGPYFDALPVDLRIVSLDSPRLFTAIPQLWQYWKRERPDVVLATQAHVNGVLGWLSLWLPDIKFVGRETSLPSRARLQKNLPAWEDAIYRGGYRRLTAVICPSNVVAEELRRDYRIPADRLPVIPNPVDLTALDSAADKSLPDSLKDFFGTPGVFIAVASGRLEAVKGFDLLLDAAANLPDHFRFVILGEGSERAALEERIERLGLSGRIIMPGFEDNPHCVVARAGAFVLSSRYEGFPNAVLEALGVGTPVAGFRTPGGAAEILEDGVTGFLAEPENPLSLAEALKRVFETSWSRAALKARIRDRYDGPSIVARYRQVLREVNDA